MDDPHDGFPLFITHVDGEGPFLRISGQVDKQTLGLLESLLAKCRNDFDKGIGAVLPASVVEGMVCAVKYKDGVYYRVKIISTNDLERGIVGVLFIDYGNKDLVSVHAARLLEAQDSLLTELPPLAEHFYLWRIVNPGRWNESVLLKLQNMLCYGEYPALIMGSLDGVPFIHIQYKGQDLSTYLEQTLALYMHVPDAQVPPMQDEASGYSWPTYSSPGDIAYSEVVPFTNNQNFPSNPASTMRQNIKAPRAVSLRPPARQPFSAQGSYPCSPKSVISASMSGSPTVSLSSVHSSPTRVKTIKSRLLETNATYKVFVPYADEGPELFAVQLVEETDILYEMMEKINNRPHQSLKEPPMIGSLCLGRMTIDRMVCRAIVMNICGSQCKLYFIDFGDTEMTAYYDIFDIPEEFITPHAFAMRFCLSGLKKITKGPHTIETFKKLVEEKVITLKVVPPEGPPLIQYGELYVDKANVLDLLMADHAPRYTKMKLVPVGESTLALVSYVDSCAKFYIHMSSLITNLNFVMEAMKKHCQTSVPPKEVSVGTACCALFPEDGKWYRALVLRIDGSRITVFYVDYGNEQEVELSDLRTTTLDFTQLPALAMRCALKDFETKGDDQMLANQLEMLVLEKTFTVHVKGMVTPDTMLVTLTDERVNPVIHIGQVMSQLSKPKQELKSQAPKYESHSSSDRRQPPKSEDYKRPPPMLKPPTYRRKVRPEDAALESAEGQDTASATSSPPKYEQPHSRSTDKPSDEQKRGRGEAAADRRSRYREPAGARKRDDRTQETQRRFPRRPSEEPDGGYDRGDRGYNRRFNDGDNSRRDFNNRDNAARGDYNTRDRTSSRDYNNRDTASSRDYNRDNNARGDHNRDNISRGDHNRDNNSRGDHNRDNNSRGDHNRDNNSRGDHNRDNISRGDHNRDNNPRGDNNRDNNARRDQNPRRDRPQRNLDNSFGSDSSNKQPKPRGKFTQVKPKVLANPQPLNKPFKVLIIDPEAQHEVAVTWIVSPDSFYNQILTYQPKFVEMMERVHTVYRGVKNYSGPISEGDSVLARFPEDGVLYRATIISVRPLGKFVVQYVDYGNKQLIENKDIWQLDDWLMELPKLAVHCQLVGVTSKDGPWKADQDVDRCFNAPRYQCVFLESVEGVYRVSMYNNGVSVADMLVEKGLAEAIPAPDAAAVELKDEPIDWALLVNNNYIARVSHIESVAKLFVQLDLETLALIEELLGKASLTPEEADKFMEHMPCAVKWEDKVYRAVIRNHSDLEAVKLNLYDYGYQVDVKHHEVMVSPSEVSCFYPQAIECCIDDQKTPVKTLEQVKELLLGKKVIVHVDSVNSYRLMTTMYSLESGEKFEMFEEADVAAAAAISPLCPRAVYNHSFGSACVSHCASLTEIYLHKATDIDGIALMLDDLYKYYEEGNEVELLSEYEKGGLCAAKSSDGNWYRAVVSSVDDEAVEVQFPDYGNFEIIAKTSIKKLAKQFNEPCARALLVSLGLEPTDDAALATLQEWIADKELQVTLSCQKQHGQWLANLHLDGDDLAMKLISGNLASPIPESGGEGAGSTLVYVSHVDSPGQFWLQMPAMVNVIEEVQAELQANAKDYPPLEKRELGTVCAAQYSADDQWYRAEVLDADADITTVRFIDYGNADVLNNTPSSLRQLPERLAAMPASALKASVNAVPTGTGEWSEPATELFTKLLGDGVDPYPANIVLTGQTTYIDVFVDGANVTDALVADGHATRADCSGDLPSCFASHVNSPAEFWIQLASSTEEFQVMEAQLAKADTFPKLDVKLDDVICAAKFNDDNCYYRAQIIVDGSEGTEVLFMDYGNASISNDLRLIPTELVSKPALARKCALQKPHDIKTWSRRAEEKFNEIAAEGATIFKVQFIASGDISVVELFLDGKSITETLVTLCEEETLCSKPSTPVEPDKIFTGKLNYVKSTKTFFVLLEEQEAALESVQEQLRAAAEGDEYEPLSRREVGTVCAALSTTDDCWYRAKILQAADPDTETEIEFIDYGNQESCTQLKQLPEKLSALEPLVKRCSLLDADNNPEELTAKLQTMAEEEISFQVVFLDRTKDPLVVKLLLNGEDVCAVKTAREKLASENDANVAQTRLREEPTSVCHVDDDYIDCTMTQENGNSDQTLTKHDMSHELDDSNASCITVISVSPTADTGYTSSTDMVRSPNTDLVTDEDSLSPRKQESAEPDEYNLVDANITCTELRTPQEPHSTAETGLVNVNIKAPSDDNVDEETEQLSASQINAAIVTSEDDLEKQSTETASVEGIQKAESHEAAIIGKKNEEFPKEIEGVSSVTEAEKLPSDKEVDELESAKGAEELESVKEAEDLEAVKEAEELESVKEAEDLESVKEAENLPSSKGVEALESVKEVEDLESVKEAEESESVKEAEELESVKEAEKLESVNEAEDLESVKEAEKLPSATGVEALESVKEVEDLESVKEAEKLPSAKGVEALESVKEVEDLESVKEAEKLESVKEAEKLESVNEADEIEYTAKEKEMLLRIYETEKISAIKGIEETPPIMKTLKVLKEDTHKLTPIKEENNGFTEETLTKSISKDNPKQTE